MDRLLSLSSSESTLDSDPRPYAYLRHSHLADASTANFVNFPMNIVRTYSCIRVRYVHTCCCHFRQHNNVILKRQYRQSCVYCYPISGTTNRANRIFILFTVIAD
jgi:hypothetical protein